MEKKRNNLQFNSEFKRTLKGIESGYNGSADIMANGQMIPGLQMASKEFTLFVVWNLVNPICSFSKKKKER